MGSWETPPPYIYLQIDLASLSVKQSSQWPLVKPLHHDDWGISQWVQILDVPYLLNDLQQFSLSDLLQHLLSCSRWKISARKRLRCKVWTSGICSHEKHPILKIYRKTIVLRLNNTQLKTDLFDPYWRKTSCYFQINISGVYHLESHDSGYADYLLAMDIPKAAVPHILAA